jgi:carbon monoxide dehydrogenase subunit G
MRFHESVVINRPPDEVWAFLTDFFNSPRVRPGALALRRTSPGPLGRGSVLQGRMTILGFETRVTMTVTEFDPPRSAVVTVAARPGRGALRFALEPTPDGTRVDRTADFELHPAFVLMSPILGFIVRRQARAASMNWKRLIEGTPPNASQNLAMLDPELSSALEHGQDVAGRILEPGDRRAVVR